MGSVFCVDTSMLGRSAELQKKLKLEDILINHTKYFSIGDIENGVVERTWRPLKFATTIRSMTSNKVLCQYDKENDRSIFYHTYGSVDRFIHKGYDLVMFLSSMSVMECLNETSDKILVSEVMCNHSIFDCRGLYFNLEIIDPVVYSMIYLEDEPFDRLFDNMNLANNWRVEDVANITNFSKGNIKAILDDIVLVKGEKDA